MLVSPRVLRPGLDWLLARPWLVLLAGSAIAAVAFPGVAAGALGLMFLAGGAGVLAVAGWPSLPLRLRRPSPQIATWLALAAVVVVAIVVFKDVFGRRVGWMWGDWGPQREVLRSILPGLQDGDVPVWNHRVATGDAPLELYPAFTYLLTGEIALVTGMTHDLMTLMLAVATAVHVLLALCVTRLALRLAPAPLAAAVGILCLVDTGHISSGGVSGLLQWALFHSAVGQLFCLLAAIAVLDAVRQPRLSSSVRIWVFTALAVASHPASLLVTGIMVLALGAVVLLARDAPPRRAIAAIVHLGLGLALGAVVWMPMGERLLDSGQHFSSVLAEPGRWLGDRLRSPVPQTDYALVVYAGFLGILAGLWSRRAAPVFIAAAGLLTLLGLCDAPYLGLDLAPGTSVARLGAERFFQLSRPFVFVAAAYLLGHVGHHAVAAWRHADRPSRLIAGAALGVLLAFGLRAGCSLGHAVSERAVATARSGAPPQAADRAPLLAYLRDELAAMGPARWGRAVTDEGAWYLHIVAETGVPMFHMGPIPTILNRERIEDLSPASLRRFNVRWVITAGAPPNPSLPGVPGTERKLGSYYVREVPGWDGRFARIERGGGEVTVTRLDDHVVEIDLTGTDQPALVALGTGYYPRWRGRRDDGHAVPVYAYPATPGGNMHVPAAWVPPGRTRFTCDGPLPSDGKGRIPARAALALAVLGILAWSLRRPRQRILRAMAALRRRLLVRRRELALLAASVVALGLILIGALTHGRPMRALEVGSGVRARAVVEARVSDQRPWQRCSYHVLAGEFRCAGLATITDAAATILNDHQPLWPFTTPMIYVRPDARRSGPIEVRIRMTRRLAGRYWGGSSGNPVRIEVSGEAPLFSDHQLDVTFADRGERSITVTGVVPAGGLWLTLVRYDTLQPPRRFLAPPPPEPPAEIAGKR